MKDVTHKHVWDLLMDPGNKARQDCLYLYGWACKINGLIVELGCQTCVSTAFLLLAAQEHTGMVYSYDIDGSFSKLFEDHPRWRFFHADSRDEDAPALAGLEQGSISLLFIDTSHKKEDTEKELRVWLPLVEEGGVVLLHDAEWCYEGVTKPVVSYLKEENNASKWDCHMIGTMYGMMVMRRKHRSEIEQGA